MSSTETQTLPQITLSDVTAPPPGWETAVKCLKQGDGDIVAIQKVYDVLPPPAYPATVATIIGSIYANSYWNGTRLDPARLSASLQKALGWGKSDCDRAAGDAFRRWSGLLVRANVSDVGTIPRTGAVSDSLDVIVNADGPLTASTMLRNWNSRFYNATAGKKNYVYARAQSVNLPVSIERPSLRMFSTDGGFNQPPSSWQVLYTFDEPRENEVPLEGMVAGPIEPAGRAAAGKALGFEPPASGHYCLIAVASTEFFTNDPLGSTGNWDSAQWITYNGAAGWHNIDVAQAGRTTLRFYNQDDQPERFAFEVTSAKVPAGTRIELDSPGAALQNATIAVVGSHHRARSPEVVLPAGFAGDLGVTIRTPDGAPLPADASVEVRMVWLVPEGHPTHREAARQLGVASGTVEVGMGNFTFIGSLD